MKNFKNKFLSIGISLGFILSCSNTTFANSNFSDVGSNHWAIKEINEFQNKKIVQGYEDGTFKPNNNITRAEFMKIITQAFGINTLNNSVSTQFSDIKGHWAELYIRNGVSNGAYDYVLDGTLNSSFRFRPNDFITREEAFTILATYLGINDRGEIDRLSYFYDGNEVVYWAKRSVEGLIEHGFLQGYENRTINPKGKLTRAEVVKMIDRVEEIGKATNVLYENYHEGNRNDLTYVYEDINNFGLENIPYGTYIRDNFYIFNDIHGYDTDYEVEGDAFVIVRKNDYKVLTFYYDCIVDPETNKVYYLNNNNGNSTTSYITEEQACKIIEQYIYNIVGYAPNAIAVFETDDNGNYHILAEQYNEDGMRSTFGWFWVDKKTGEITR